MTCSLGVQRVRGDHYAGQVDAGEGVQQRGEPVDFTGLAVHAELSEHDPGVLVDHREQMSAGDFGAVAASVSGAAHRLAVHREDPVPPDRRDLHAQVLHKPAHRGVETVGIHFPEQAADGRFRRTAPVGVEGLGELVGQVGNPFGDGDERTRPGHDRAHHHGQHHPQAMADTASLAGIDHRSQHVTQVRREHHRIG